MDSSTGLGAKPSCSLKMLILPVYLPYVLVLFCFKNMRFIRVARMGIKRGIRARGEMQSVPGLNFHLKMLDQGLFLLMSSLDFAYEVKGMVFSLSSWKRKLHARHLILLMHELLDDLNQLHGRKFRKGLTSIPNGRVIQTAFDSGLKDLRSQTSEVRKLYKYIRNTVGAHRDHNPIKQLSCIESIDVLQVLPIANVWITAFGVLAHSYTVLFQELRRPEVMVSNYFN